VPDSPFELVDLPEVPAYIGVGNLNPLAFYKPLVCSNREAYPDPMDGNERSGVIVYIAIGVLILFLSYAFVKACRTEPPQPHAPIHDSKLTLPDWPSLPTVLLAVPDAGTRLGLHG
jgi:hypothetical protein